MPKEEKDYKTNDNLIIGRNAVIELLKSGREVENVLISKGEREGLVNLLKKLPVTLNGTRQWNEAIVTKGGISTKDINPSTMESKIIKNLYFAGEVLDLDALTGGYNLQIAWSTGALAGKSINKEE